jgi:hypothetical protein
MVFNGDWLTCKIRVMSMLLQVSLHTRKGLAPVLCFSAQCTAANQEARQRGADDFAQELIVRLEACVCCSNSVLPPIQNTLR